VSTKPLNQYTKMMQLFALYPFKWWVVGIGVTGGWINLAYTDPLMVLASGVMGSWAISIFLAIGTIIGQGIGKILLKEIAIIWNKHKQRKKNGPKPGED
jgi:hypothetical protein